MGANKALERALQIWQKEYDKEPIVVTTYNNLTGVLRKQGNLESAWRLLERALRIDETFYGPDHPDVARDVNNLGRVLEELGDLADAEEIYERVLEVKKQLDDLDYDYPYIRDFRSKLEQLREE